MLRSYHLIKTNQVTHWGPVFFWIFFKNALCIELSFTNVLWSLCWNSKGISTAVCTDFSNFGLLSKLETSQPSVFVDKFVAPHLLSNSISFQLSRCHDLSISLYLFDIMFPFMFNYLMCQFHFSSCELATKVVKWHP